MLSTYAFSLLGPPVTSSAADLGLGLLVSQGLAEQSGGSLDYAWDQEGLVVTIRVNAKKLAF